MVDTGTEYKPTAYADTIRETRLNASTVTRDNGVSMTSTDVHTLDQLSAYITQLETDHAVTYPTDEYQEELS